MSDRIISCDIDGVLADGVYVPPEKRNVAGMSGLAVADPLAPYYLSGLCHRSLVYLLSSRAWPGALYGTQLWLRKRYFDDSQLAGIICNISTNNKLQVATLLGATYHIDDDPEIVLCYNGTGTLPLLLYNPHRPLPLVQHNHFFPTWEHLADWLCRKDALASVAPQQPPSATSAKGQNK